MWGVVQSMVGTHSGLAWGVLGEGVQDKKEPLRATMADLSLLWVDLISSCFTDTKLKP